MDNHEFDFLIAQKLSELKPEFDPQAWKDMDQMLESVSPLPWYQRPNYKLLAIAATLFTVVNAGLLIFTLNERSKIEQLSVIQESEPTFLASENETLFFELPTVTVLSQSSDLAPSIRAQQKTDYSASKYSVNNNTSRPSGFNQEINSSAYFVPPSANKEASDAQSALLEHTPSSLLAPHILESINYSQVDIILVDKEILSPEQGDDYFVESSKGIASRFGFTTGMNQQYGDLGNMYMAPRNGLLSEFSLKRGTRSSNLKLMLGATLTNINYGVSGIDENISKSEKFSDFPGVNLKVEDSEPLPESVIVNNKLVQIPIYLKYQAPVSNKFSVFAGAGPTLDILASQRFTYSLFKLENGLATNEELIENVKKPNLYLGSMGSALGFEYRATNWLAFQSEINYRYGLKPVGVEKRDISAFSVNFNFLFKL